MGVGPRGRRGKPFLSSALFDENPAGIDSSQSAIGLGQIYLEPAYLPWNTKGAFQGRAVPAARIRSGRIGGGQEFE